MPGKPVRSIAEKSPKNFPVFGGFLCLLKKSGTCPDFLSRYALHFICEHSSQSSHFPFSSLSTLQSQLCIRVVMRKYLGIIISLLRHIFRTVLRQTNTVSVSDGVKRNTVLGGCDGEIRGLQANSARTAVPSTVTPPSSRFSHRQPPSAPRTQTSGLAYRSHPLLAESARPFRGTHAAVSVTSLSYPAYWCHRT